MFEHRSHKVIPRKKFYKRVLLYAFLALAFIGFSLFIGMVGYHYWGGLNWIDSLLNASMILTGMGPVDPMPNDTAKMFASFYAIYSGVAFLTSVAVFLAPAVHRFMHILNIDTKE